MMETTIVNMDPILTLALFVAIMAAVCISLWALRSGRLTTEMMTTGTAMLEGVSDAAGALAKATGNPAVSVASFIFKAAGQAAHAAEQLHRVGDIAAEERNDTAKAIAEDLLKLAGIEVTEDRKAAIAVLLEAECDMMGHMLQAEECTTVEAALELDEAQAQEVEIEPVEQPEIAQAVEMEEEQVTEEVPNE